MGTVVHLYSRFSHISQASGDSRKRQQAAAEAFCRRHGFSLSREEYHDGGRSGWRRAAGAEGTARLVGKQRALESFLKAVARGQVQPGDVLLVENLDRLSRKGIRSTRQLIDKILDTGVRIAILHPSEQIYDNSNAEGDVAAAVQLATLAFSANAYSEALSKRVKSAYDSHHQAIIEGKQSRFKNPKRWASMPPSWLQWDAESEGWVEKPEQVAAIRYAFERLAEGIGRSTVVQELNQKYPPPGGRRNSQGWNSAFFHRVLKDRTVLGRLHSSRGEIPDYYPPIIAEELWIRANAHAAKNRRVRGPQSGHVNIWNGLLVSGLDRSPLHLVGAVTSTINRNGRKRVYRRFRSYSRIQGKAAADPFSYHADRLELCILSLLPQVELDTQRGPADSLRDQRLYLETEVEAIQEQITSRAGSAKILGPVLINLQAQLDSVESQLRELGGDAIRPTKAYRQRVASMARGTASERQQLRDAVQAIVRRVAVLGIKMGPRRHDKVRCLIEVEFRNGQTARAIELSDGQMVVVRSPQAGPSLADQLAGGWTFGIQEYQRAVKAASKAQKGSK